MDKRFPVVALVRESLATPWRLRRRAAELASLPLLLMVVLERISNWLPEGLLSDLVGVAASAPIALFAVPWHQSVRVRGGAQQAWVPTLDRQHLGYLLRFGAWKFGAYGCAVIVGMLALWASSAAEQPNGSLFSFVLTLNVLLFEALWAPLGLFLPAYVAGDRTTLRTLVGESTGSFLGVGLVCGVMPWSSALLVGQGIGLLPTETGMPLLDGILDAIAGMMTLSVAVILQLTALSLVYERVSDADGISRSPASVPPGRAT